MFNYIILSSSNSRYLQALPQKYRGYCTPTRRQHSLVLLSPHREIFDALLNKPLRGKIMP